MIWLGANGEAELILTRAVDEVRPESPARQTPVGTLLLQRECCNLEKAEHLGKPCSL